MILHGSTGLSMLEPLPANRERRAFSVKRRNRVSRDPKPFDGTKFGTRKTCLPFLPKLFVFRKEKNCVSYFFFLSFFVALR